MNNTLPPQLSSHNGGAATPQNNLDSNLINSLDQQRQARIQAIQTLTQIKVGETVAAVVDSISQQPTSTKAAETNPQQLSPGQQQLLAAIQKQVAGTNQPATVNTPLINQVNLRINQQTVTVATPLPLKVGQPVNVTLTQAGDLKLLTTPSQRVPTGANAKVQAELTQALRENLPNQRPVSELLQHVSNIVSKPALNQALLSKPLREALSQLLQQPLDASNPKPERLREALINSGNYLENRLLQPKAYPDTNVQQDLKGQLLQLKQYLETTPSTSQTPTQQAPTPAVGQTPTVGATVGTTAGVTTATTAQTTGKLTTPNVYSANGHLQARGDVASKTAEAPLNQERMTPEQAGRLAAESTPLPTGSKPATESAANPLLATTLPNFTSAMLGLFNSSAGRAGDFDLKQLRTQLTVLLHRQLLQTLAGITSHQANSLLQKQASTETGGTLYHWNIELPIKMGEHLVPMHISVEEKPEYDDNPGTNKKAEKARRWEVRMSFELPDDGNLHAHIRVVNDTVNASLWAEQPQLLEKAKQQLQTLQQRMQKSGVTVEKIECLAGSPPTQANSLGYALVDIKT